MTDAEKIALLFIGGPVNHDGKERLVIAIDRANGWVNLDNGLERVPVAAIEIPPMVYLSHGDGPLQHLTYREAKR